MKRNPLVFSTLTFALTLASCAGPESYQAKMERYKPQSYGTNQVPQMTSAAGFEYSTKGRGPASVGRDKGTTVGEMPTDEATLSNKKLYFLTLFGQYESMKKYSSQFDAPTVNVCPHFHNSLLEHKGKGTGGFAGNVPPKSMKKFVYDTDKLSDPSYVALHPELSLPLAKDEVTPRVIDIYNSQRTSMNESKMNEMVHSAIDIHLSKTYAEIRELCEFGVSDNYYIYENLITHIKNSNFSPAEKNMNTLLKTTVFSNIALVTSLDKISATPMRSIASVEPKKDISVPYSNELMTRLNVEWAREYFNYLKTSK